MPERQYEPRVSRSTFNALLFDGSNAIEMIAWLTRLGHLASLDQTEGTIEIVQAYRGEARGIVEIITPGAYAVEEDDGIVRPRRRADFEAIYRERTRP